MDWMDNDVIFLRLIAALGLRPIRVPDLSAPSILLREYRILLISTELTRDDRHHAVEHALWYWVADAQGELHP